ncbi:MAG: glutamate-1-semialdehyde 2,1-aminomutase [Methanobrevibacter sp.]|jgi:glutamate-1-semialdehyde 2,1-aminomutase|nr:glutamate-1-semialdehyde 2,1-aminomutase [Candidatus Methanoflexus mossambicus]
MNSKELFDLAKNYIPGGVSSPVRAFKPYPFFAKRAKGSKIWDVDGKEYIDHCLAYGPLILGHSNDKVIGDVKKQLEIGTTYGVPSELEIKLAKMVVDRVPYVEMIRFVNSGTEATMAAIRLARGFTSKNKIIKFDGAYHGAHDYVLVKPGSGGMTSPDSLGIPKDTTKNTLSVPFNNEEAIETIVKENYEDVAAIILEPVMGNIGCVEPKTGFLKFLRALCDEYNILLIFDEVITGFRLSRGCAGEYFGVYPDLVTFGKIIGGGFPMGAFGGKKEIMENIAPSGSVYQAGTFNGNPISVTGGIATLNQLDYGFYKDLKDKGDFIRNRLVEFKDENLLKLQVVGLASMFQIYFNNEKVLNYEIAKKSDTDKFNSYFNHLLSNGVFIPPSQFECCFISNAHSDEDLENVVNTIEEAILKLK